MKVLVDTLNQRDRSYARGDGIAEGWGHYWHRDPDCDTAVFTVFFMMSITSVFSCDRRCDSAGTLRVRTVWARRHEISKATLVLSAA